MEEIKYFVFFDLETTGLPWMENNRTKITELSMVAVSRTNLIYSQRQTIPRVVHKLSLCFDPQKMIDFQAMEITGLNNLLLDGESPFDESAGEIIDLFLKRLQAPICLVAHNGYNFDYSILKTHLEKSNKSLSDDISCIDSILMFRVLMANDNSNTKLEDGSEVILNDNSEESTSYSVKENLHSTPTKCMKVSTDGERNVNFTEDTFKSFIGNLDADLRNSSILNTPEKTPIKNEFGNLSSPSTPSFNNSKRKMPESPRQSYKLEDIYQRLFGRPAADTHRAECDCTMLLECFAARAKEYVVWCDNNRVLLKDFDCMETGKKFPRFTPEKSRAKVNLFP